MLQPRPSAAASQKRSLHTDEREEAMRTNWPAYVAAEMNRIVADEEAFERLVDLFKQAHGRAPASDCDAYQWAQEMDDVALTALGFEGRDRFRYNYDLCLIVEYGPRAGAGGTDCRPCQALASPALAGSAGP